MYQYQCMNLNQQLCKAVALAAEYHSYCEDWNGKPSLLHLLRVMNTVETDDIKTKIVAVLHDILEDTICTISELKKYFDDEIIEAIILMTHGIEEETNEDAYLRYIQNILDSKNRHAILVKKADLLDNMQGSRIEPKKVTAHIKCYSKHLKAMCMILERVKNDRI